MRNKQSKKLLESMLYLRNKLRDKKIYYAWDELTIDMSEKEAEEVVAQ